MLEHTVHLLDGRKLQALEDGDPRGVPIFSLHGTPGSRLSAPSIVTFSKANRIRIISYDRPGYGDSTRMPGRTIGDTANDVAAIADALGIERFAVAGYSGGGAPTLACAALLPKRVVGAASLAGVAPYGVEGLDWMAGAGESNREDFELMIHDRPAWEAKSRKDAAEMLAATPDQFREIMTTLLSDVDRAAYTPEVAEFIHRQGHEGLKNGDEGMRDDNLSDIKHWGFELADIRVPVQIWHGGQDRFVPFAHGQWIAAHVPGAEVHLEPNEGHVSIIVNRSPVAFEWLSSKF